MGIEELRLGLAAVGALSVPPASAAAIDGVVGCSGHDDVRSLDLDEGAIPFLVSKGSFTVENDLFTILDGASIQKTFSSYLSAIRKIGEVQSLTSGHFDVVQHNCGA